MISPRWRKVLRDLWGNKIRTILVILAISVGVFAVGFVSTSFNIIMNDMDADYQASNPHGAIIYTEPFSDELLESLKKVPGVGQVEGRSGLSGRLLMEDGERYLINITAIPPVEEIQVDQIEPATHGIKLALEKHQVFIDRSAVSSLKIKPGDLLKIELFDGTVRQLSVAEIVHDVNGIPFAFTRQLSGFVNQETLAWLGGSEEFDQVYMTVAENKRDEAHVRAVANEVSDKIERSGRQSFFTLVFNPGRHFASDITQALGAMMGFLGFLAVGLSAFLVVNTINALLSQHVRQIGVMKAIGASTWQLVGMYVVLVMCFGILAFLVAAPPSIYLANGVAGGIAEYLNFDRGAFRAPPSALVLQLVVSLVVPVLAAMIPVFGGTRITIREAIGNYGLGGGHFGKGLIDRTLERVRFLPRPLLISLRNTFRRKFRLYLTLSTLILAGAIFISVFNLRASMRVAIEETFGYILSDVNISFDRAYRIQEVAPLTLLEPDVVGAEGWAEMIGRVLTSDRKASTEVLILAPPAKSTLIDPTLTSGRWLVPQDENAIVIGNHLLAVRPELKLGDEVIIDVNRDESPWKIVGTYRMAGNVIPPIVYANYEYLTRLLGQPNQVGSLRVITSGHDLGIQQRVGRNLEAIYTKAGIGVTSVNLGAQLMAANTSSTDILVYFLLVMAVLIAVVGGLGMTSTMSMNVIERTREIGVIRAIGASNGSVMQLVIVEGMLIGVISWIVGAVLAIPIGMVLANIVGVAFFRSPLPFVFSMDGFLVWLVIVIILAGLASFLPARNASRLTVREVLAYE